MTRICRLGIKINGGTEINLEESLGMYLIKSPDVYQPPLRDYETIKYPEENGVEVDDRTVMEPFDYEVKIGFVGTTGQANAKISELFGLLFTIDASTGLTMPNRIELFNYYKKVKIVGIPKQYNGDSSQFDGMSDVVVFDFSTFVDKPQECDFNY